MAKKRKTAITGHRSNLDTIVRAAQDGRLALVECTDRVTKKPVAVLCAIGGPDGLGEYIIVPFARMFDGDPYEQLDPPNPDVLPALGLK